MLKKLLFLAITAILLTGCGASEPTEETFAAATAPETTSHFREETVGQEPAAATGAAAEYFRFTDRTNTVTDDDGNTILYERKARADFSSPDETTSAWVQSILGQIGDNFDANSMNLYGYAKDYLEENGTELFYSYSNYQQLGAARHDEAMISLIELSSLYSGGTHPNSVQTAYNLDIENQRLLRLEDVIIEGSESELARMVREGVEEKFAVIDGMNGLFGDYADTITGSFTYGSMTPYWYFNDRGLVIFYNQYELGPYAAGIIKVELEYGELDSILLPEFFPAEHTAPGSISLCDYGFNTIPITIDPEGKTLFIGVEGVIHQVQLSELLWLEDTPIAQELLFSANSLGSGDVLEITGGYDDENRSFAIQFRNDKGLQVLYIHDGELSEEP